nr:hypothetical protein [Achromobacter insolitus]
MTATPSDPHATQHGSTPDPDTQAPMDAQTRRLREENRALRELLVAQAQAAPSPQAPGPLRRLIWWLISAPGAALVGWRALVGREDGRPLTGKRVGYATLTVLYTLAIYGALVLLVVSWSSPNTTSSSATTASPVRVPLLPPPLNGESVSTQPESAPVAPSLPAAKSEPEPAASIPTSETTPTEPRVAPPTQPEHASMQRVATNAGDDPGTAPKSILRVTEIPAEAPMAWIDELKKELARCSTMGFFERPDCSWAARKQFCEPNHAWGTINECPNRP